MIRFDQRAFLWVVDHRVTWLNPLLEGLTYGATGGWLWLVLAALLAWSANRRVAAYVALTALTVWSADAISFIVKSITGRARPFETLPNVDLLVGAPSSLSFPSGHATTAFAGATLLSICFPRAAVPLLTLASTIAFSRIYVGVHYPSDVVAGAALGTSMALLVIVLRSSPRIRALVGRVEARVRRRIHRPTL